MPRRKKRQELSPQSPVSPRASQDTDQQAMSIEADTGKQALREDGDTGQQALSIEGKMEVQETEPVEGTGLVQEARLVLETDSLQGTGSVEEEVSLSGTS